jgi:TRAP-type C4-dicarboxylate transport system permease small subunit
MCLFAVMTWQSIKQAQSKWNSGLVTGTLGIPLWPFYLISAMGCLVVLFVFTADLFRSARKRAEE